MDDRTEAQVKTAFYGYIIVALLLSCATSPPPLPEPEKFSDSLLIGAFSVEFPDGYRAGAVSFAAATTFVEGVSLYFRNVTRDEDFVVEVDSSGYYHFLSNGTDEFLLRGFSYLGETARRITLISGEINIHIDNMPGSLIYLGHNAFIFSKTEEGRRAQNLETDWNTTEVSRHIHTRNDQKLCWWMACRVVENRFEVLDEYLGKVNVYPASRPFKGSPPPRTPWF